MTKILGIAGKKQSGKTSASNFLCGAEMVHRGLISYFHIDELGKLVVPTDQKNEAGEIIESTMELCSNNPVFNEWLDINLFPYVKPYAFADKLKKMCIEVLGLSWEQVYGTDEQKNILTKFQYPVSHDLAGQHMTGRQVMQYMGNKMREFYPDVWVDAAINQIKKEDSDLAVIMDVRFPNEVAAIKEAGGKVVRLTRSNHEDNDKSEISLDKDVYDWENFDLVIDNQNMTIDECHSELHKKMIEWQYVEYNFIGG